MSITNSSEIQSDDAPYLERSLKNVVESNELKWIFVGGKGGVGKTTCSCALSLLLAKRGKRVLLISTDPAHSLSDFWKQKFTKVPTKVACVENLSVMEVDPTVGFNDLPNEYFAGDDILSSSRGIIQEIASSFPGIDEAMSYVIIMKLVRKMEYSVVVFDTAPTGHTLRLLSFPATMEKGLRKINSLKDRILPVIRQFSMLFGIADLTQDLFSDKMAQMMVVMNQVNQQLRNPQLTTFICVCIAEFLSLYETERLIQELSNCHIDVHNIIVNQLVNTSSKDSCRMCSKRKAIQDKYVKELLALYDEDMHVIKIPLQEYEITGRTSIDEICNYMVTPYDDSIHESTSNDKSIPKTKEETVIPPRKDHD